MGKLKMPLAWDDLPTLKEIMRFKSKIKVERGCWIWQGYTDENGYGQFSWRGKTVWVIRFAYAAYKGKIKKGFHVNHIRERGGRKLCRSHSCCNPDHLNLLTPSGNSLEMHQRRTAPAPF